MEVVWWILGCDSWKGIELAVINEPSGKIFANSRAVPGIWIGFSVSINQINTLLSLSNGTDMHVDAVKIRASSGGREREMERALRSSMHVF